MRVVIDTNVFVSSFLGGHPRQVIDLWKGGDIILCLSKEILNEYVDVLQSVGLGSEEELAELLALFKKGIHLLFTTKTPSLQIVRDDPTDDKFIACAVKLNAECIITEDKAVKAIGDYQGIRILAPRDFLVKY